MRRDEERKKDEKEKVYRNNFYERKRGIQKVKKGQVKLGKEGGGPGKGNLGRQEGRLS